MTYYHFLPGEGASGRVCCRYEWALVSKLGYLYLCSRSLCSGVLLSKKLTQDRPVTIQTRDYGPDLKDRILRRTKLKGFVPEDFYLVGGIPAKESDVSS